MSNNDTPLEHVHDLDNNACGQECDGTYVSKRNVILCFASSARLASRVTGVASSDIGIESLFFYYPRKTRYSKRVLREMIISPQLRAGPSTDGQS